tara:strand:- start:880 stop:1185 length:306 start_codon:yes stop_codon:yes gene_type:complete
MANTQKFTKEEIQSIEELKKSVGIVFTQLGQLSIQKARTIQQFEEQETALIQKHLELAQSEQDIFKGLNEKYGDGNYDPKTGEFTPVEQESPAKEEVEEAK